MDSRPSDKQQFRRQLLKRQLFVTASLILLIATFVFLTFTGPNEPNAELGQTHEVTVRALTTYLTGGQIWLLKTEAALAVVAFVANWVFMLKNRQHLRR